MIIFISFLLSFAFILLISFFDKRISFNYYEHGGFLNFIVFAIFNSLFYFLPLFVFYFLVFLGLFGYEI